MVVGKGSRLATGSFAAHAFAVAAAIAVTAGFAGAVSAQEAAATATVAGPLDQTGWTGTCAGDGRAALDCTMTQRATVTATGQLVAAITIRVPSDTRTPVMLVQVPYGISVPAGITLTVDTGASQLVGIQTCDAGGCYGGLTLPPEFVTAMAAGNVLNVTIEDLNHADIIVPVSLGGFSAVFAEIE